jgi:steroid delta-isomerase-like uncharacterized protein
MSEANKTIVRRWFEEVWNQGRTETIDALFAPNARAHGLGDLPPGPEGFKPFHAAFRRAFPDIRITLDDVIAEGDLVAYRFTATGTHRGDGLGFAATNRGTEFTGMGFARVRNGQLVEGWNNYDQLSMFQQLGVVQGP